LLYSVEGVIKDFSAIKFEITKRKTITLNERDYHKGEAVVIRIEGTKR
jgi:hypothetical protein